MSQNVRKVALGGLAQAAIAACVEMPAPVWESLVRRDESIVGKLSKQNLKVRVVDVKKAIRGGESVAGTDLEFRNHLLRKY